MPRLQIVNHVDLATAFTVTRFPYAHGVYSQARFWVETKPAYGQRAMTQFKDPKSETWYRAKHDGYCDISVMEVETHDATLTANSIELGLVVIHNIDFKLPMYTVDVIKSFAEYFVLTPYQKERVMKALAKHGCYTSPNWKDSAVLDYELNRKAETKQTVHDKAMERRQRNEVGIVIESAEDVLKRERKEREAFNGLLKAPRPVDADADDTTGMTPAQIAVYNEMMGKS